jgi:pyruvate,water dikinase
MVGRVNPDEYCVFKPLLQKGFRSILYKQIGTKSSKIVYTATGTKTLKITSKEKHSYCLTDDEILQLSHWCCDIERFALIRY